jgi:hypothetical protein
MPLEIIGSACHKKAIGCFVNFNAYFRRKIRTFTKQESPMKKLLLFISAVFYLTSGSAQSVTRLVGASPFQDSLWVFDTTNFTVLRRLGPTPSAGGAFTGMNGIARHPVTGEIYTINKQSAVTGRVLGKLNPLTGLVTIIGNLGDNFSSITFNSSGTLYGVTGDGATVPETAYIINTTDASKTLLRALGSGADGEVICFNPTDNMIYHWSGNGTIVFEKFDTLGVAVTNIPITGATSGETFGMVHVSGNDFIGSNIGSRFQRWNANGTVGAQYGNTAPDDIRGTAFLTCARVISGTPSFCFGDSTLLSMSAGGSSYQWYKNGALIAGATSQTYYASVAGYYNCIISDACGTDSLAANVHVVRFALPVVSLSGSTNLCPGGSVNLTGSSGGASQWYLNGSPVGGATSNTYAATVAGVYNMTKTNINGCYDSASVGITVVNVTAPVVNLGTDTTQCAGTVVLDAQNAGLSYLWTDASTAQTLAVSSTGTYDVTVTNANGCATNDAIVVTINSLPVVSLGTDVIQCGGTVTLDAQNAGAAYVWTDMSTAQALAVSSTGTYDVTVTDGNGCIGMDTIDVTINSLPVVDLGNDSSFCAGGAGIMLDAQNAGSTYLWNDGTTTQMLTAASAGTYSVTVTDANGCEGTDAVVITVNALPVITLTSSADSVCDYGMPLTLNATPAGGTYSGTGVTGASFDPAVAGMGAHSVYYAYTDMNGCSATDTTQIFVDLCTGIAAVTEAEIRIYPNPASDNLVIDMAGINTSALMSICDVSGKLVMQEKLNGGSAVQVNISAFENGIYFVNISNGVSVSKQRLVVAK